MLRTGVSVDLPDEGSEDRPVLPDFLLSVSEWDLGLRSSSLGTAEYAGAVGMSLINGNAIAFRHNVPRDNRSKNPDMSSPKAIRARLAKKNALNPKPERGNAVAVPRCSGQLKVAG